MPLLLWNGEDIRDISMIQMEMRRSGEEIGKLTGVITGIKILPQMEVIDSVGK